MAQPIDLVNTLRQNITEFLRVARRMNDSAEDLNTMMQVDPNYLTTLFLESPPSDLDQQTVEDALSALVPLEAYFRSPIEGTANIPFVTFIKMKS